MNSASTLQRTILYKKPYSELIKFIESCSAFEVLTVDEEFWQEKALLDFKVPKWYFNLTSGIMSPPQNYLYFLTKFNLIPESDQVLDLNECFAKAAGMGDLFLIEIFLKKMEEKQVEPDFNKAFIEAIRGGHLSVAKYLENRTQFYQHYLIFACDSGNIDMFNYVFNLSKDNGWKEGSCHLTGNCMLLEALSVSYEFYIQIRNVTGYDFSHIFLGFDPIRITKTGSVESFRRISSFIRNFNKELLTGAFISRNQTLIEEIIQRFSVPVQISLECQRMAYAYLGDVENYSALVAKEQISGIDLLDDVRYALSNKSYPIIAWIFNNKDFQKEQPVVFCSVIQSITLESDAGLFNYICQFFTQELQTQLCLENFKLAIRSGCIPLIELYSKQLPKGLSLPSFSTQNLISQQIFEENRPE